MSDDQPNTQTLVLSAAHTLRLERSSEGDLVRIFGADGGAALTVHVSARGLEVKLEGVSLTLQTTGDLTLDAERLRLRGRDAVDIETDGALSLEAREQTIAATLGSVTVRANDDVALNGERIRLNCDDDEP